MAGPFKVAYEMIQAMFKPKKPEIKVIQYWDGELHFHSDQELEFEKYDVTVRFHRDATAEANILVTEALEEENTYVGKLMGDPKLGARLTSMYPPPPPPEEPVPTWEEKRSIERVQRNLGVMCKDFKNFKGLTHDLTEKGVRLIAEAPIEPGKVLDIRMEIDDARVPAMEYKATVVWCQPENTANERFFMGCTIELTEDQLEALTGFLEFFRNYDEDVFDKQYARD